jgi:ABC-2 type transport system permease protein
MPPPRSPTRSRTRKGSGLAATADLTIQSSEPPRLRHLSRLRELIRARQLLGNLVRKEVKVKYKSSVLGAAWSMLNPLLYLAVFTLVFKVVLKSGIPDFSVYLLSGLLAWNFFSTSLGLAARAVVDNANLVTKVYFPREILPLASEGAALVDFFLQALVLAAFMVLLRVGVLGVNLLLLPLALFALLVFTAALSLWVGALNVRYRDTQHLLNLALLTWFWLTPVVYAGAQLWDTLQRHPLWLDVYLANPLVGIVFGFQRALYGQVSPGGVPVLPPVSVGWLAILLGGISAGSIVLFLLAWRTFFHLSGDFAEEL